MHAAFQQVLTIDAVHIRTAIAGGVAQTEVEQVWRNDTDAAQEGSYLFPLPEGATVSDFALYDGDRKMVGRLLDKDQAADTYEGIVRRVDPRLRCRLCPIGSSVAAAARLVNCRYVMAWFRFLKAEYRWV